MKEPFPNPFASFGCPSGKIEVQAESGAPFGKASVSVARRKRNNNDRKTALSIAARSFAEID